MKLPVGKIVCVGRNYAEHARELGNEVPDEPLLFIKPGTALVDLEPGFKIPSSFGACHFETEIAVLIAKPLVSSIYNKLEITDQEIESSIAGFGIALDLTLRDLQNKLKAKSHPWEIAKGFDGSCPVGRFYTNSIRMNDLGLKCIINKEVRQSGFAIDMKVHIHDLIRHITGYFTLEPGDVVLTGTPEGVGALNRNDEIQFELLSKNQQGIVSKLVEYGSKVNDC